MSSGGGSLSAGGGNFSASVSSGRYVSSTPSYSSGGPTHYRRPRTFFEQVMDCIKCIVCCPPLTCLCLCLVSILVVVLYVNSVVGNYKPHVVTWTDPQATVLPMSSTLLGLGTGLTVSLDPTKQTGGKASNISSPINVYAVKSSTASLPTPDKTRTVSLSADPLIKGFATDLGSDSYHYLGVHVNKGSVLRLGYQFKSAAPYDNSPAFTVYVVTEADLGQWLANPAKAVTSKLYLHTADLYPKATTSTESITVNSNGPAYILWMWYQKSNSAEQIRRNFVEGRFTFDVKQTYYTAPSDKPTCSLSLSQQTCSIENLDWNYLVIQQETAADTETTIGDSYKIAYSYAPNVLKIVGISALILVLMVCGVVLVVACTVALAVGAYKFVKGRKAKSSTSAYPSANPYEQPQQPSYTQPQQQPSYAQPYQTPYSQPYQSGNPYQNFA